MTSTQKPSSLELTFDDNQLAPQLYGQFDQNLALIEQILDVEISSRGNHLLLIGTPTALDQARSVLETLYAQLEEGRAVEAADVEACVRMVLTQGSADPEKSPEKKSKKSGVKAKGKAHIQMAQIQTRKKTILARTPNQDKYMRALSEYELVFAGGPAGTGKTYIAVAYAAMLLERGEIERIILSRPAVEAGENLGFLPGDMKEKVDPYLRPLYDALYDMMQPEHVDRYIEARTIEVAPLAFMRGRTLTNACVILDEAQNTTSMQMKMFLTRLGENSKMIVTGDPSQVDLPRGERSGLIEALNLLQNVKGIHQTHFTDKDVVRHELVARIVRAYDRVIPARKGYTTDKPDNDTAT